MQESKIIIYLDNTIDYNTCPIDTKYKSDPTLPYRKPFELSYEFGDMVLLPLNKNKCNRDFVAFLIC